MIVDVDLALMRQGRTDPDLHHPEDLIPIWPEGSLP